MPNLLIGLSSPAIEEKISVPSKVAIEIITDVAPVPARIQAIVFWDLLFCRYSCLANYGAGSFCWQKMTTEIEKEIIVRIPFLNIKYFLKDEYLI
ncbi:MAG: hypothetical protein KAY50_03525 [Chitinophagaceae bacterium]|nr:hypothetical protein [Chitinophagaceae bacterium]